MEKYFYKHMKALERQLKAFANKRRLAIVSYLKRRGQSSVGDIASGIKLSFKATSKHLVILYGADVLEKQQVSLTVLYALGQSQTAITKAIINVL